MQNYTSVGYKVVNCPKKLYSKLRKAFHEKFADKNTVGARKLLLTSDKFESLEFSKKNQSSVHTLIRIVFFLFSLPLFFCFLSRCGAKA